ncbi:hypothetical protein QE152_g21790 [Popillia japonica]|uniref:Uncharacterized protein n=1 Tax=Popillia japonica TaxID=7064 RepID=A0AAW1KME4_POPJA
MVQIVGTYEHVETTNPEVILKAAGQEVTSEKVAGLTVANSKVVFEGNGDDYVLTTTIGDTWKRETKFTLGKTFEETMGTEKISTTVVKEGDKLVFKSTSGTRSGERTYEFTDAGVTMMLNVDGVQAKRVYKRA